MRNRQLLINDQKMHYCIKEAHIANILTSLEKWVTVRRSRSSDSENPLVLDRVNGICGLAALKQR